MRDVLSFELGNEKEKGIFRLVTSVGRRQNFFSEKILSPYEKSKLRPSGSALRCSNH